jgi:hypothetical protein
MSAIAMDPRVRGDDVLSQRHYCLAPAVPRGFAVLYDLEKNTRTTMKTLLALAAFTLAACGKSAAPDSPLDAAARQTCKNTIEARAINRKTVVYLDDDQPVAKTAKGELEVPLKFSAKNEIGIASTMQARCTVSADGKALVAIAVKDAR